MKFWDNSDIRWTICKQSAPRSTDNHTNTPTVQHLISQFLQAGCSSWRPTISVTALQCFKLTLTKWTLVYKLTQRTQPWLLHTSFHRTDLLELFPDCNHCTIFKNLASLSCSPIATKTSLVQLSFPTDHTLLGGRAQCIGVRRTNKVIAPWARLVLGWVTVFGRVYHLSM